MAMYQCPVCDIMKDDDWSPMQEHPWGKMFYKYENEFCCESCAHELAAEMKEVGKEDYFDD